MNPLGDPGSFEDSHSTYTTAPPTQTTLSHLTAVGTKITNTPGLAFRFLTINVQGFQSSAIATSVQMLGNECKTCHADFVGITEPNVDLYQPSVYSQVREGILSIDQSTQVTKSTTPFTFPSAYKPGGVVTFMFERLCCRSGKSWTDPTGQGRYVVNTVMGNNNKTLAIVTTYQVHFDAPAGPTSIRTQRDAVTQIKSPSVTQVDTRATFWKDMIILINNLHDMGHKVMLMGDFNESLYTGRRRDLSNLATICGLVDPLHITCPDAANAPTFLRGSHRIDFILVDDDIAHGIVGCGILAPNPALSPAHRAVFCDISFDAIFGMPAVTLQTRLNRTVTPTNIRACAAMSPSSDCLIRAIVSPAVCDITRESSEVRSK